MSDALLRRHIYDVTLANGAPPSIQALADATGDAINEVAQGLKHLAAGRIVVLQPDSGEILMAPPFSAVPTPFVVESARHDAYANCAWDAVGVPIMLHEPARIAAACGCCGERMTLEGYVPMRRQRAAI